MIADNLMQRIKQLEEEKAKIQDEFGQQRAKMKELYVQKEGKSTYKL